MTGRHRRALVVLVAAVLGVGLLQPATAASPAFHYSSVRLVLRVPLGAQLEDVSSNGAKVLYATGPSRRQGTFDVLHVFDRTSRKTVTVWRAGHRTVRRGAVTHAGFTDAQHVIFEVYGPGQVRGHWATEVYLADLASGSVREVSADADGTPANDSTTYSAYDPRSDTVALNSYATNLDPQADFVGSYGIANYLKNLTTGAVTQADLNAAGHQVAQSHNCEADAIASGATQLLFSCGGSGITAGTSKNDADCYLHDVTTGSWRLLSADSRGRELHHAYNKCIGFSADGRRVMVQTEVRSVWRMGVKRLADGHWSLLRAPIAGGLSPDWSREFYVQAGPSGDAEYVMSTLSGIHRQRVSVTRGGAWSRNGAADGVFAAGGRLFFWDTVSPRQLPTSNMPGARKGYDAIYVQRSAR